MHIRKFMLAALLLAFGAGSASATTYNVNFFASNFSSAPGIVAPSPAIFQGNFQVSLDTTQDYTNETAGIVVGSLNLNVGSPLAFNYDSATDVFQIGGSAGGAATVQFNPATDDFWLYIHNFSAGLFSSEMFQAGYAQVALGNNIFSTPQLGGHPLDNPNGFAFVGAVVATTPLPAGLPLFLTALAAIGVVARRRRATAAAAA
jgi:hypothetical protein